MPGQSISESVVIFRTLSPLSSQSFELMGRPHFPPLALLCVHISLLSLSGGPQGPGGPNVVERGVGSGAGLWGTERRVRSYWTSLPGLQWAVGCVLHLGGALSFCEGSFAWRGAEDRGRCCRHRCTGCHGDGAVRTPSFLSASP